MIVKLYVPISIRKVDEIDLSEIDCHDVRAVLLPQSPSAIHSFNLLNSVFRTASSFTQKKSLPSPIDSSEDEMCEPEAILSHNISKIARRKVKHKDCNEKIPILLLKQSLNVEKFTFGTSNQSDVILKKHDEASDADCYLNLSHCHFYPDPDNDGLMLYNPSNSTFSVQPLGALGDPTTIAPSTRAFMECGSWLLTLGEGFQFHIRILPRPREESGYIWTLISACIPTNLKINAAETVSRKPSARFPNTRKPRKFPYFRKTSRKLRLPPTSPHFPKVSQGPLVSFESVVGKTSLTKVFKVRRNGNVVAAKMCRRPDLEWAATTWKNEADILRNLDHPFIVKLLESDAVRLTLWLEYIPGQSLEKFVDENSMSLFSEDTQHHIWRNISEAIKYIHAKKIIHCDIKPENIILGEDGRGAVLCDFGESCNGTRPVGNGGTPCYLPPEFLIDTKRSFPADIWAVGVTMLYVGKVITLPRRNWRIADIHRDANVQNKMYEWLLELDKVQKQIPQHLSLIRNMLKPNPKDRITASDLAKSLRRLRNTKSRPLHLEVG